MSAELSCPMCGTHLELGHLLVDAENRAAFLRLMAVATPLAGYLEKYVYLFSPPKTTLVVNNLVCRAMNAAAAAHWPQVDAQVIAGC